MHRRHSVRPRRVAGTAVAVALCVVSLGSSFAQAPREPNDEMLIWAGAVGEIVQGGCAQVAAVPDGRKLDEMAEGLKRRVADSQARVTAAEEELKRQRAQTEQARSAYRRLTIETVKAQENVDRAEASGQPAVATQPLRTRLADVDRQRLEAEARLLKSDEEETQALNRTRRERNGLAVTRVVARSIEICIEKRRAELSPPVVSKPADPTATPFNLAGTWAGACGDFKVNGSFTIHVAKGGALSGKYTDTAGKGGGTLSGTLAPDGKLAAGSGREADFTVTWLGMVVGGPGGLSGKGTWSGAAQGLRCGGSWLTTKGQPA